VAPELRRRLATQACGARYNVETRLLGGNRSAAPGTQKVDKRNHHAEKKKATTDQRREHCGRYKTPEQTRRTSQLRGARART